MKKIREFLKKIPEKNKNAIKFFGNTFLSFGIMMIYSYLIGAVCYALMGWNSQRVTIIVMIMINFFPLGAVKHFNIPKFLR